MRYPLIEPIADADCADCARPVTFSQGEHLYRQKDGRYIGECCIADPENAESDDDCLTVPRCSRCDGMLIEDEISEGRCEECSGAWNPNDEQYPSRA